MSLTVLSYVMKLNRSQRGCSLSALFSIGGELFYSKFLCLIGLQKYWAGKKISAGLLHAFGA